MKLKNILKKVVLPILGAKALIMAATINYYIDRVEKPDWYDKHWKMLSECVWADVDVSEQPKYYSVKTKTFPNLFKGRYVVRYFPNIHLVLFAEGYEKNKDVVGHEMLHAMGIRNENIVENLLEKCLEEEKRFDLK